MSGSLYFGDNLDVLRQSIRDESVDLIYLDPPFNSNATYNVLFRSPRGGRSEAQIEAFEDTWHWNEHAEAAFAEVEECSNVEAASIMRSIRSFLGENDMMAYLSMMAVRLLELKRVLKQNGSLYLHCDPTASHYLRLVMDAVFGKENFRNEIIWKRTGSHNSARRFGPVHDVIFYYANAGEPVWNSPRQDYSEAYKAKFGKIDAATGEAFQDVALTGPGTRQGPSGQEWRGFDPTSQGRHWAINAYLQSKYTQITGNDLADFDLLQRLDELDRVGLIYWPRNSGFPRYKQSLTDAPGLPLSDVWTDLDAINSQAQERLGYPTQKPVALLERIIAASSNPGDVILDPFCGCGTTVHAAQKLGRQWIGIDITHLAISLIERRLKDAFPGITIAVEGTPKDLDGARDLAERDKYQFQWWATSLIGAVPAGGKKKGMDRGIDGYVNFRDGENKPKVAIVSVKGGQNVNAAMIRDLKGTMEREKAPMGIFITLVEPTREMIKEAASASYYETAGLRFSRVQIVTIEALLGGKKIDVPMGFLEGFRRAAREVIPEAQHRLL